MNTNCEKTYSNSKLFVDFGSRTLVQTANPKNGTFFSKKKNQSKKDYFRHGWRCPWSEIDKQNKYLFNFHITINPDPKCEWITNCQDRKLHNEKLREFIMKIKNRGLFKYILCIYEYGTKGKSHGKLHYHILFKTHASNAIRKEANIIFGTSKNRCYMTTIVKPIRVDKKLSLEATPEQKLTNYKNQIDYIINTYFRKETHNKIKCLFTNIRKRK